MLGLTISRNCWPVLSRTLLGENAELSRTTAMLGTTTGDDGDAADGDGLDEYPGEDGGREVAAVGCFPAAFPSVLAHAASPPPTASTASAAPVTNTVRIVAHSFCPVHCSITETLPGPATVPSARGQTAEPALSHVLRLSLSGRLTMPAISLDTR
jgi:hypothetical protein